MLNETKTEEKENEREGKAPSSSHDKGSVPYSQEKVFVETVAGGRVEPKEAKKKKRHLIVKIIYIIIGCIALALGTVGIILPILPTVPFFLLTAFCFVRGSDKFHIWFVGSKLYKKHLENFVKHKMMSITGEMILLFCVSLMLITSMYFINRLEVTIILTVLLALKYSYFIKYITTVSPEKLKEVRALEAAAAAAAEAERVPPSEGESFSSAAKKR